MGWLKPVVAWRIPPRRGRPKLHRQRNAFSGHIHLHHLNFNDIARLHHLARIGHKLVAELAHVHQAILMHAQIDERAKGRHVTDRALQYHAFFQVFDIFHAIVEARHLEVWPGVTPWFLQFLQNILDRDHAKLRVDKKLGAQRFEHVGAAHQAGNGLARLDNDLLNHGIGLWMDASHVQRVVAPANAQKAGALLKGFGPQTGHIQQLLTGFESAILIAPAHDRLGNSSTQARYVCQQGYAGGVEINAHRVHAVFHNSLQTFGQITLVHVVLVLAYTNGFGVDLHEFGQRVLQAPCNAGGAAQAHIHIRHLLRREFAGGIDRGTSFTDNHLFDHALRAFGQLLDQVARQLVRLAAGCAIPDRNQIDAMLLAKLPQCKQRALPVFARLMRVDHGGVHQFARGVHHRHLDAGANAGIQAQHHAWPSRGGQEQVAQVVGKHLDGYLLRLFTQTRKQVPLDRKAKLDAPRPGNALSDQVVTGKPGVAPVQKQGNARLSQRYGSLACTLCVRSSFGLGQHQFSLQNIQCTTAKHGQRPVRRHAANRLVVVKIIAKLGNITVVFILARHQRRTKQAFVPKPLAQSLYQGRVLCPALAQDIANTIQHGGNGGEICLFFFTLYQRFQRHHISYGLLVGRKRRVGKQQIRQRLQTRLARQLAFGSAL